MFSVFLEREGIFCIRGCKVWFNFSIFWRVGAVGVWNGKFLIGGFLGVWFIDFFVIIDIWGFFLVIGWGLLFLKIIGSCFGCCLYFGFGFCGVFIVFICKVN